MTRHLGLSMAAALALLAGCAADPPPMPLADAAAAAPAPTTRPADAPPTPTPPPALPDRPALGDYLAYAALHNPGLEAAFNRWRAAVARGPQVRSLPDPRLSYRYFIEEVETRVGAQRQSFGVSQTLPWLGKLALRGDAADQAANAERQRYEHEKLLLFQRVKDAYHEYAFLGESIATVKDNLQLLGNLEKVMRTRYRAAAASHPDVIRVQVELGRLDDRLRTLEDLRGPTAARLDAALNRPAGPPPPWPGAIEDRALALDDEMLLAWMEQSNPQLRALASDLARSRHEVDLARKGYFPDVTVGLTYIQTSPSTHGRHPPDDGKDPVMATVSLNVPIWWDKLAAGVREARRRQTVAARQKQDKANVLAAELKLVLYHVRDAGRKINLYRDTLLPKARQALRAVQTAFQAGKASFSDLIDAQRLYLAFELAGKRAATDKAKRLAELEVLVGRQIPRGGDAPPTGRTKP